MSNLAFDTLNALDLFDDGNNDDTDDNENDKIILHIPHSSTNIPLRVGYIANSKTIHDELALITDWSTDTIFSNKYVSKIQCDFSRIYCDVERLQVNEPMDIFGRGIYYTKLIDGKPLRNIINYVRKDVQRLYDKHYEYFNSVIASKLSSLNTALIIDCHSFNDIPLSFEDNTKERPDICIGINEFHTPIELQTKVKDYFNSLGYSVEIDYPYSNTIVPYAYLNKNKAVQSIMVEVNKRLYMGNGNVIDANVQTLNSVMNNLYKIL